MRCLGDVIRVLIALITLGPTLGAATVETWTDGIYDVESDGAIQAAASTDATVECTPLLKILPVPIVVAFVAPPRRATLRAPVLPTLLTRAPPLL